MKSKRGQKSRGENDNLPGTHGLRPQWSSAPQSTGVHAISVCKGWCLTNVQGSLVFEIFKTQADGGVHGCDSSVTAAQVSRLADTELSMAAV